MSLLVNEGKLEPDILSKMRDAAPKLIDFAKSFDPNSKEKGNDSNLLIVFYVQIMPDDFVMQLHRF
ncbi:DUF2713 family protein [Escherichia coli]|nr:DUF2713 family protein [Escherichia coli]WFM55607.1 DUF2713 family protein [Escherichia coli]